MLKSRLKAFLLAASAALTATATLSYSGWTAPATTSESGNNAGPGYLDCDGTRYMTIPHTEEFDISAGSSMTVSAKVWLDSYGTHRGIICNRYHEGTKNSGTTGFDIYGGNTSTQSMSNNVNLNKGSWNNLGHPWCNTLATGQWATVTWVLNGTDGTSKMYLDGVLKNTRENSDITKYPINPQCDILVGARYNIADNVLSTVDQTSFWKGKITDVRFYSKALSDEEVVADMTATVGPQTEGLIAAYDFNSIDRLSVTDISGNGHNGVLVGFPEYQPGSKITIEQPVGGNIQVFDGEAEVLNGQNVEDGTVLTLEATADDDYLFKEFTVNGAPISRSSFTVDGAATVSATFDRDPSAPTKVLVFGMNENGSKYYRIPALCCTPKGTLIAAADKRGNSLGDLPNTISVVVKRSTDNGQTWSDMQVIAQGNAASNKTYGDPAIICDRKTGTILCVFSGDTGFFTYPYGNTKPGFYYVKSTDDGLTWSEPVNFSSQIWQDGWYSAFIASGGALQTADGRIMFVANARMTPAMSTAGVYEYVIYTDDLGETWHVANTEQSNGPVNGGGNESKLVETSKGLIMSIRSPGKRRFAHSTDGGVTWTKATAVKELFEPDCNGDIIVYPSTDGQTRMLHSLPADASVRRNVSIYLSYDEGETWPVCKTLVSGYSAYSSLTVLPDGSIGCFLEEGKWDSNLPGEDGFNLYFMKFTLEWLTDGSDSGESGNDIYDGTLNLDGKRYMIIPNSEEFNIPAGGSISVSVKAKLDNSTTQALISNRVRNYANGNNNDVSGWAIYTVPTTTSVSFNYPGTSWTARHHNHTGHISTGEWHHLCWVYSGSASAFYVDGQFVANPPTTVSGSAIPSYADIIVGANYVMTDGQKFSPDNINSYVTGNIDDVRIYRNALSANDVQSDRESATPLNGKNLIAAYDFAEIKGTEVTDISGNGHTGTLVGFPAVKGQYTLNITAPNEEQGSLQVFNGETEVLNGRKVAEGTELTIVATPAKNYLLKEVTVNGDRLETTENTGSFVMKDETTVAAVFERDPEAPIEYCEPDGIPSSARYINTIRISDALGNSLDFAGNGSNGGFTDRTADAVFTTTAGSEVTVNVTDGVGTWMHEYMYIDYGCDGIFDVDPEIGVANNDLVTFNCYSIDNKQTWHNSIGETVSNNQSVANGNIPAFTIPADLPTGDYRARLRVAWCDVNPCSTLADIGTEVGKACIDFTIHISSNGLDTPRTVTVVNADEALGSVAIADPATEGNSVTTDCKEVTIEAIPVETAAFMNWTDADGEVVSTDARYTYRGETDATFTAHFGHMITMMPASGGSVTVTTGTETVKNGTVLAHRTEITVNATPDEGMMLDCILLNGAETQPTTGTTSITFIVSENTSIEAVFDFVHYTFNITATEGGSVEVRDAITNSSEPDGNVINNGDMITAHTEAYVFITPEEKYDITSVIVTNGDNTTDTTEETLGWMNDNGQYIYPFYDAVGNVKIAVTFTEKNAIADIIANAGNGPTEYYNLQGIKVKAENLTPGVYLMRNGATTAKILVK